MGTFFVLIDRVRSKKSTMDYRRDDPKRGRFEGNETTVSSTAELSEDFVATGSLEYSDIRNEADLIRHLDEPTEDAIAEGRLKIHMMELGLTGWYKDKRRYMKPDVSLLFENKLMFRCLDMNFRNTNRLRFFC